MFPPAGDSYVSKKKIEGKCIQHILWIIFSSQDLDSGDVTIEFMRCFFDPSFPT